MKSPCVYTVQVPQAALNGQVTSTSARTHHQLHCTPWSTLPPPPTFLPLESAFEAPPDSHISVADTEPYGCRTTALHSDSLMHASNSSHQSCIEHPRFSSPGSPTSFKRAQHDAAYDAAKFSHYHLSGSDSVRSGMHAVYATPFTDSPSSHPPLQRPSRPSTHHPGPSQHPGAVHLQPPSVPSPCMRPMHATQTAQRRNSSPRTSSRNLLESLYMIRRAESSSGSVPSTSSTLRVSPRKRLEFSPEAPTSFQGSSHACGQYNLASITAENLDSLPHIAPLSQPGLPSMHEPRGANLPPQALCAAEKFQQCRPKGGQGSSAAPAVFEHLKSPLPDIRNGATCLVIMHALGAVLCYVLSCARLAQKPKGTLAALCHMSMTAYNDAYVHELALNACVSWIERICLYLCLCVLFPHLVLPPSCFLAFSAPQLLESATIRQCGFQN
jgi:hypothetical protein